MAEIRNPGWSGRDAFHVIAGSSAGLPISAFMSVLRSSLFGVAIDARIGSRRCST